MIVINWKKGTFRIGGEFYARSDDARFVRATAESQITTTVPISKPDGRKNRTGGKKPARKLLRPIKSHSKRANFVLWFLESEEGGTIGSCMTEFGMTRANVFAYWTNITRDHGIGYELTNHTIKPVLPRGATADSIFKVTT